MAFKVVSGNFVGQEESGGYGSADGYGGTVVLSTDASVFYYGALAVDALDVTHNLRAYPEYIYAATGSVAFGSSAFYNALTGARLGQLAFNSSVYGLNPSGDDFWVYDAQANRLRYFTPN